MALKLRPTGLGSGIDKDRPDYTVVPLGFPRDSHTPIRLATDWRGWQSAISSRSSAYQPPYKPAGAAIPLVQLHDAPALHVILRPRSAN